MIWRKNDLNQMERYYANSSNKALAVVLGRSVDAIQRKAQRLALKKLIGYNKTTNVIVANDGRKRSVGRKHVTSRKRATSNKRRSN